MTDRSILRHIRARLAPLVSDVRGATAVEYGLIVALVVIAMVAALSRVADVNTNLWTTVSTKVRAAN